MTTVWGIHNDRPSLDLIRGEFVSVGWDEIGDLRPLTGPGADLKRQLAAAYPTAKPGAIPVWAGVLNRFATGMAIGDYVIGPNKADSTLNFGRISGDYYFDAEAEYHRHRRPVTWLRTGVPRVEFSQSALYEIGSAVTLFKVNRHAAEFLGFLNGKGVSGGPGGGSGPGGGAGQLGESDDTPNVRRITDHTRDFVINTLHRGLGPQSFEEFVAALLRAMGYRSTATQYSGDGGVDVVAYRDPLGLEPPLIKVQCKRMVNTIGGPEVQKLVGTLAPGGGEVGMFITLGNYSSDAIRMERIRHDLRLVNGAQLVDLVLEHYESLDPEWKQLLPIRQVYVVDRELGTF